ncbi:HD-GYP domain-containing protein [uncultured Clostridium sp.]|uniref:HD-GYP domain-containing protein n=1 Tax=uncultured Clostridium sp. TaxID=59620 RepID=UPI0025DF9EC7|nr:HD-GYP domain-containing protein [uncultured Clostridium sp.]
MIFVPFYRLKKGMKVADNISLSDKSDKKITGAFLLRKGTILTQDNIDRLERFDISGVYIEDGRKNPVLDEKLRRESVCILNQIFDLCENTQAILNEATIKQIESISNKLVDNIYKNEEISVSISDLQTYDMNTYMHSLSVAVISIAIGTALYLDKKSLCRLGVSALLHDIGKLKIPIEIINKPSKLTEEEYEIIKFHPQFGGDYVMENESISQDIYEGIVSHHEKVNGTGYPNKLKGNDIPLFGKIISVADVYDALTGKRAYREPVKPSEAVEYIMAGVGSSFDYDIVKAFLKRIEPYPIGACVRLSDKRHGIVIKGNRENPLRPVIKIINSNSKEKIIDLQNDPDSINIVISDIDYNYLVTMNKNENCV